MNKQTKAEAERAHLHAESTKLAAEAKKLSAEARQAKAKAEIAEIELAEKRYAELKRTTTDEHYHVYRFTSRVEEASVKACMERLAMWHRLDPDCDIEIVFSSPGGAVVPGMALFDYIRSLSNGGGHRITTYALGYAASMAGILLQAGDHRVMAPESWLLIHEGSFGAVGSVGEVEDTVEWVKAIGNRILNIFAERSNLSKAQLKRRWHRRDWWIDSDSALKWGFVDEVR